MNALLGGMGGLGGFAAPAPPAGESRLVDNMPVTLAVEHDDPLKKLICCLWKRGHLRFRYNEE